MFVLCRLIPRAIRKRRGAANGNPSAPRNAADTQGSSPDPAAGYHIYALSEGSSTPVGANNDAQKSPFNLNVICASQAQLPEDSPLLARFLLDPPSSASSHLLRSSTTEKHVVVSTRSGLCLAEGFYKRVLAPLLAAVGLSEADYRLTVTRDKNTIRDLARGLAGNSAGDGEKLVVLLSGDGGVVDMLNGLDHARDQAGHSSTTPLPPRPPTIALLPLGTGNALFHSLHKPHYSASPAPSPLVLALRTLFSGRPAPLPTFRATFSPGARLVAGHAPPPSSSPQAQEQSQSSDSQGQPVTHLVGAIVASYGFHASIVWESDTPAYRVHGDKRFGMAAAELLKIAHAYDAQVKVRVPGEGGGNSFAPLRSITSSDDDDGRFSYILATMVSNLEKTFTISPGSRPLDGRLRLVHFGHVSGEKTMEIMQAAYKDGAHVGMEEVGYEEVEEVKVTIAEEDARWRKVCIDGSIVEIERGGWMAVAKEPTETVRVLVDDSVTSAAGV
ncbi:hypothetical protein N656DRAFT_839032 [Canariomyces notabilis]|uniref:DAGKc domain-containing protein n=1 Tax=Canariomyces notabilis TaxID=2074819 RepID=A0AAN6QG37_9PEZI|nr:hypothetical protein N656DRAFT_839032 [Canariomyces arenarius]